LEFRRHKQFASRDKGPEKKLAERGTFTHNAPDGIWRNLEDLRIALGYRAYQRRPAGQQIDVSAELVYVMHGNRLGLAARMLHDPYCAALDDEEFIVARPRLEQ
jgi:hypothetical protein